MLHARQGTATSRKVEAKHEFTAQRRKIPTRCTGLQRQPDALPDLIWAKQRERSAWGLFSVAGLSKKKAG